MNNDRTTEIKEINRPIKTHVKSIINFRSGKYTYNFENDFQYRKEFFIVSDFVERFSNSYFKDFFDSSDNGEEIKDEIFEVVFQSKRTALYQNRNKLKLKLGDFVIVETDNGIDVATICACCEDAKSKLLTRYSNEKPKMSILRFVTNEDYDKFSKNCNDEIYAMKHSRELIRKHKLDMKVTDADWQFDRQRLTISFTSPHRVDFRNLVKDMARDFKTRIELRQISTREEAKRLGGMGACGKSLCCSLYGCDNCHITLEHARVQQLSNNVSKLSGYCGRLKCCMMYEYDLYVEAFKDLPEMGSMIWFKGDKGKVLKTDIFKANILVYLEKAGTYRTIEKEEIVDLFKNNKIKRPDYSVIPNDPEIEELKKISD